MLLNFVDDFTNIKTTEFEWEQHYKEVFEIMIGSKEAPEDVLVIHFNVSGRGIAPNPMDGKPIYK